MSEHDTMTASPRRSDLRDFIVPPAILVCTAAVGVASHLHLSVPLELASALALLLFSVALVGHVLLARPAVRPRRPRTSAPQPGTDDATRAKAAADATAQVETPLQADPVVSGTTVGTAIASAAVEPAAIEPVSVPVVTANFDAPPSACDVPAAWTMRPGDIVLPSDGGPRLAAPGATGSAAPAGNLVESERITAVLRRLATQLRSSGTDTAQTSPELPYPAAAEAPDAVEAARNPDAPAAETSTLQSADSSLSGAVDALRITMAAMRAVAPQVSSPAPDSTSATRDGAAPTQSAEPTASQPLRTEAELRLAAVAEALARERLEVFLEPIIGLADDSTCHFEVSIRLRGSDDRSLDTSLLSLSPRGSEIVPLLDAVRVRHSAGIALKLERSGREGSVFSEVAGPSLQSPRFVQGVAQRQADGIADRIVLTFAQNEVRGLGPAQLGALAHLRDLGFRFALQGVVDLDMDFELLHACGFEFVKLDADVFLDGLPLLGGRVPSADICRHFASLGLMVIVRQLENEAMRSRILGFGVTFGQGQLFGSPRPVRITNARPISEAAGAAA